MPNKLNLLNYKIYSIIFLLLFALDASSQGQYASDVDLKAAYCFHYVKNSEEEFNRISDNLPVLSSGAADKFKNINEAGLVHDNKLRIYLLARSKSHNSGAQLEVSAAMTAGEKAASVMNKIKSQSASQLDSKNLSSETFVDQIKSCWKNNGAEILKLDICNKLSFLPY